MQDPDGTVSGMKVIGAKEDTIFTDGGQVLLNVKREQKLE
jgi:hypothetical protein